MKATKRFLSAIMAMSMVFGTVVSVSAADEENVSGNSASGWSGTMSGNGESEGYVNMEVFRIQLPTTKIDYVVDAQGLIKQSTANGKAKTRGEGKTTVVYSTKEAAKEITDAKVAPVVDEANPAKNNYVKKDGFVFFVTTTGEGKTATTRMANYLNIEIENKSSFSVDVAPVLSYETSAGSIPGEAYSSEPGEKSLAFNLYQKKPVIESNKVTGYKYVDDDGNGLTAESKISVGDASACYDTVYAEASGDTPAGYKYTLNDTKYKAAKDLNNKLTFTLEGVAATDIEDGKTPGTVKIVWNFTKTETEDTENSGG